MTNYSYATAATELGCTESWLREVTPKRPLPHIKFGSGKGPVIFTDAHIAAIRKMFEVQPQTTAAQLRPVTRRRAS